MFTAGLTLAQIGERLGVSRERARQIHLHHFPHLPKPLVIRSMREYDYCAKYTDLLLSSASDAEIAAATKLGLMKVRELRRQALVRKRGYWSVHNMKRALHGILRREGYGWCGRCCQVKPLEEGFSPGHRKQSGKMCSSCNTERQRNNYRTNPKLREYCKRYNREHPEYRRAYQQQHRKAKAETIYKAEIHPELLEKIAAVSPVLAGAVRSGEMPLPAAAIRAGLQNNRISHAADLKGFMRAIRRYLTRSEVRQLKESLNDDTD